MSQLYDIVDENDQVIGQTNGDELHRRGLIHRGINVIFYTKTGNIVLQKRSSSKKTFPNKLDVTVGGHVDSGETYEQSAIREIFEETGLRINPNDLQFLLKFRRINKDQSTNTISDYFCTVYIYNFEKDIKNLQIEKNDATCFIFKPIESLINPSQKEIEDCSPSLIKDDYKKVWEKLLELIKN